MMDVILIVVVFVVAWAMVVVDNKEETRDLTVGLHLAQMKIFLRDRYVAKEATPLLAALDVLMPCSLHFREHVPVATISYNIKTN